MQSAQLPTERMAALDIYLREAALPVIVAPMFLVSGPALICACRTAGVVGAFPSVNARTVDELDNWLTQIGSQQSDVPFAVNLVVHKTNDRLQQDLEVIVSHRVPLVIASVGPPDAVVAAVHGYGGKVYADVATVRHARKAAAAGVDGLILLCAGAGGHTGWLSPFAFLPAVREFFSGTVVLAGAMSDGRAIHAARTLGADLAYVGTRFIASNESLASDDYCRMLVECGADDVIATTEVTGLLGNFLRPSLEVARAQAEDTKAAMENGAGGMDLGKLGASRRWLDIRSAGQGVGAIGQREPLAEIVAELTAQYAAGRDATSSKKGR